MCGGIARRVYALIAIGRQSLADGLLPAKLETGKADEITWCTAGDNCVEFLIRQTPVGRSTYDRSYATALKEIRREKGAPIEKHTGNRPSGSVTCRRRGRPCILAAQEGGPC